MKHVESRIGQALTAQVRLRYPQYAALWVHVPNGAHLSGDPARRARQSRRLQAEGMVPGWPDYLLAVPRGDYHGLFLELKADGCRPTVKQRELLALLTAHGYVATWAAGLEAALDAVRNYLALDCTTDTTENQPPTRKRKKPVCRY